MIPVFGCETARELLEAFVDGELPTSQQVAVQSHMRSCATCSARVADMGLIGWSIRNGPRGEDPEDAKALSVIQSGVLARVRAEREQSLPARLGEMFSDMRLLWPAIGATTAVVLCLLGSVTIWQLATQKRPNSMAALLDSLANPGSDRNPLSLADARSAPRVLHDGLALDGQPEGDRMVMVAALVSQDGRVTQAELLDLPGVTNASPRGRMSDSEGRDVLNAVRNWQLAPAQSRAGRPVAVRMVYLVVQTTAVKESLRSLEGQLAPRAHPVERTKEVPTPNGTRSALGLPSASA